ncbi:MAG: hypothetical protein WBL56_18370 [Candidatus Acidiferrum sp.]
MLWLVLRFIALAILACSLLLDLADARPQTDRPHEDLHGVLSRQPLRPPLRNAVVMLRYSPDGRNLMVQERSGIYVLSRDPFALRAHIAAPEVYPARFSFDSQFLTVIGRGLILNREKVPGGPRAEARVLPFEDGCLDAELSPGAEYFACLQPSFQLVVLQLSTNEVIFSESLAATNLPYRVVFLPLYPDIAFSSPFGFRLANDWEPLAGKDMKFISMEFSPDAKTLLVKNNLDAFSVDLTTRRKKSLPGELHKRLHGSFCLQNDSLLLIASGEKDATPAMMSMAIGETVANPAFKADFVRFASNPRYALLSNDSETGVRVFDLEQDRELEVPDNFSIDIFGNEMAVLNESGSVFLYRMGEQLPFLAADLPLESLPVLRAAAVTSSLDRLALSLDGNGAIFQTATGQRAAAVPRFSAANFSGLSSAFLLLPRSLRNPPRAIQLNLFSGKSAPAWSGGKDQLVSGGTVLLEYAWQNTMGRPFAISRENDVAYRLSALDSATGQELWKREFLENSPVPFADPQGERLVLAWLGNSPGAEEAAKRIPEVWSIFKKAKPTKLDTYFEVLDARSGKTIGGLLLQRGSGPYSFDAAFSVGGALILVKDEKRISLHSLQDGRLLVQLVGALPAASAQNNLFAIQEAPGRLFLYDLATGAKLGQHVFLDSIAYMHFSADGNRLLVLTEHQVAYILDMSAFGRTAPPAASAPPSSVR